MSDQIGNLVVIGYNSLEPEKEEVISRCSNCGHLSCFNHIEFEESKKECKICKQGKARGRRKGIVKDYTGEKFKNWTVVSNGEMRGSNRYLECVCNCGNNRMIALSYLVASKIDYCNKCKNGDGTNLSKVGRPGKLKDPDVSELIKKGESFMRQNFAIQFSCKSEDFRKMMLDVCKIEVHEDGSWKRLPDEVE